MCPSRPSTALISILETKEDSGIGKLQLPKSLHTFKPKKVIEYRRAQHCSLLLNTEAGTVKDRDDVMDSNGMPLLIHGDDVPSKNSKSSAKSERGVAMTKYIYYLICTWHAGREQGVTS
jgi:hypothetical protein